MRPKTLAPLLLLTAYRFATASADEANLIVNGGFESPVVSGYVTFAAPNRFQGWAVDSGGVDLTANDFYAPAAGRQSLDLNSIVSGSIFQNVATVPGRQYVLSFAFATNPLPDDPRFPAPSVKLMRVSWNGTSVGTASQSSVGHTGTNVGWRDYSMSVVGTGTDVLSFASLTPGSAGPALDNIRLVAVPEPIACDLLTPFIGFIASFARGRFRSRSEGHSLSLALRSVTRRDA